MAIPSFAPDTLSHGRVTIADIDAVVSARLGSTRGLGKSQPACFNRQIAMYLASNVGRWSTTVIGRFYGGRDHTTVVHAIQRVEAMCESEPDLEALLCDLKLRIRAIVDSNTESASPRLISERPIHKEFRSRLLAKEFVVQLRNLIREELRSSQIRDLEGASRDSRCNEQADRE